MKAVNISRHTCVMDAAASGYPNRCGVSLDIHGTNPERGDVHTRNLGCPIAETPLVLQPGRALTNYDVFIHSDCCLPYGPGEYLITAHWYPVGYMNEPRRTATFTLTGASPSG
jgi:hypothetical protein